MNNESGFTRKPKPWSTKLFLCDCSSSEHQMLFHFDPDNGSVYCHIHLAKRPFLKRIKYGLKYIFGYYCRFGHWDEFVFNPEDAPKLKRVSSMLSTMHDVNKLTAKGNDALNQVTKITLK
jgi:hypothetical protein